MTKNGKPCQILNKKQAREKKIHVSKNANIEVLGE